MHKAMIAGNVGQDAELKHVGDNTVLSFSVAVEVRDGKDKATMWVRCSMWGKRGEAVGRYVTKGTKVAVAGDFSVRQYDSAKGPGVSVEMRVDDVTLMGGGAQGDERPQRAGNSPQQGGDDEIPF